MTNNKKEKKEEEELFKSGTPHFFKVILKDDILNGTLRIPKKFAQKHESGLSDVVHLEVPSGRVWEVELRRDDGELFLQNGWADFAQRCCLSFGYFVVFRYEGDSRFHVVILDVTACEIEYPVKPGIGTKPKAGDTRQCTLPQVGKTGKEEVQIIELSDDENLDPRLKSGRKKPPLHCPGSTKRPRTRSRLPGTDARVNGAHCSAPATWLQNSVDGRHNVGQGVKSGAFLRAASYKCKGPSSIVVIRTRRRLNLPLKFWTTCFPGSVSDIKVCISERKTWTLRASKDKHPRFYGGWKKFLADNSLRGGDVCLFVGMESLEAKFRVVIFRERSVSRMPLTRAVIGETSATDSLVNDGSSDLLKRRKLQRQCQKKPASHHSVSSPKAGKTDEEKVRVEELRENGGSNAGTDANRKNVNLDASKSVDRMRPPSHCPRPLKKLRTSSQGTDAPMGISICSSLRMQLQEPMERNHPEKPAELGKSVVIGGESSGAYQRASSFRCENPSYIVVIHSITYMNMPVSFLKTCSPGGRRRFSKIKVSVCGRGTWTLGITKERLVRFNKGWKEFVVDNELRIGDVCLFELMRCAHVEFRVVIFREGES